MDKDESIAYEIVYSQFISVDVNKEGQSVNMVKACKREDFEKWVLENKKIKLCFGDFFLGHPKIEEWLNEMLNIKSTGWEIDSYVLRKGCSLIETEENVTFYDENGNQALAKEVGW